jgi:hypothetical protein
MSKFNDIEKLWKRADSQIMTSESLDSEIIKQSISKQSIGISSKLLRSIRAGLLTLILSVPLFSYNLYGYKGNNLIAILNISCLILSTLLILYLVYQYKKFKKLDQTGLALQDLIVAKIRFFKNTLYIIHHIIATGVVLLIFALNLLIDNNQGHYQVNNIWLYISFMVIAYVIIIVTLHLIHNLYLKQYINVLDNLNESKLTEIDDEHRNYKWIRLFFLTITLLSLLAGIITFYKISKN